MHPILATLHPALRTAVLATLLVQGGLLLLAIKAGQSPWLDALPKPQAGSSLPAELLLHQLSLLLGEPMRGYVFLAAQKNMHLVREDVVNKVRGLLTRAHYEAPS